jgi:hypothetical protein
MVVLIIIDIRKSHCDNECDLITAVILRAEDQDPRYLNPAKKSCSSLLALQSGTAEREFSLIGVRKGDHFFRMLAEHNHGLDVGEAIQFMVRSN